MEALISTAVDLLKNNFKDILLLVSAGVTGRLLLAQKRVETSPALKQAENEGRKADVEAERLDREREKAIDERTQWLVGTLETQLKSMADRADRAREEASQARDEARRERETLIEHMRRLEQSNNEQTAEITALRARVEELDGFIRAQGFVPPGGRLAPSVSVNLGSKKENANGYANIRRRR